MSNKINITQHRVDGIKTTQEIDPVNLYNTTTGMVRFPLNASVVATGSAQTDAAVISLGVTYVSGGDGTKGVVLSAPDAALNGGEVYLIKNAASAVLKVYPPTGGAINALSTNAAISIASVCTVMLINMWSDLTKTGGTWYTFPLLPS
jgi:hypothetical protein